MRFETLWQILYCKKMYKVRENATLGVAHLRKYMCLLYIMFIVHVKTLQMVNGFLYVFAKIIGSSEFLCPSPVKRGLIAGVDTIHGINENKETEL